MGEPMDRSNRVFLKPYSSFAEAFPQLEEVLMESYETGKGVFRWGDAEKQNLYGSPLPLRQGLIHCSNPFCRRGGYEIDLELGRIIQDKKERAEFLMRCPGDEGSPKGRRIGRHCLNALHVRLTIKYKP